MPARSHGIHLLWSPNTVVVAKRVVVGRYARWFAAHHAHLSGQPAFLYSFSRQPPAPKQTAGAYHAGEIAFVMGDAVMGPTVPADEVLSEKMQLLWTAFAKSGDP